MIAQVNEEALKQLIFIRDNFPFYASNFLKITTKDGGALEPLFLNRAQLYMHEQLEKQLKEKGRIRALVLKGRQQGISTYTEARNFWKISMRAGVNGYILTHESDATKHLYGMVKRFYDNLVPHLRPKIAIQNENELYFNELNSGYKVGTAGNKRGGRSITLQYFHGSEVAFWPHAEEHVTGILQAVSTSPGTEIILESTANGIDNYFYQLWMKAVAEYDNGRGEWLPIFVPWFWQPEYTSNEEIELTQDEQELLRLYDDMSIQNLAWRRTKLTSFLSQKYNPEDKFKQEYPNNATEAFLFSNVRSLITSEAVIRAQKNNNIEGIGKKILGVDPAEFGDDRTAMICRQGRKVWGLETYRKKAPMEVVGLVLAKDRKENFDIICVDSVGIGSGIHDRLKELLGSKVKAVNSCRKDTVLNIDRYPNKKSEMWGEMKDWLENPDLPVSLPDDQELMQDLCVQTYRHNSSGQIVLISKNDLTGMPSPDTADALALTFAHNMQQYDDEHATIVSQFINYARM